MSDTQKDKSPEREKTPEPSSSTDAPVKKDIDCEKIGESDSSKQASKGPVIKTESDTDSKYVRLRVVGNYETNGINFRLKYTTTLLKLKKSYSAHVGVPVVNLRFIFDGRRIADDDTPKQLDMNDDDQIEVYHEQVGGF